MARGKLSRRSESGWEARRWKKLPASRNPIPSSAGIENSLPTSSTARKGADLRVGRESVRSQNIWCYVYWLNLENAAVPSGDSVSWDENSGAGCSSPGCPSFASDSSVGTIPSESFTISGSGGGSTPEPSSIMLLGSGIIGLGGVLRRRRLDG